MVTLFFQFDRGFELMFVEGLDNIYDCYYLLVEMVCDGVWDLGLDLFVSEGVESDIVIVICVLDGIDGRELLVIVCIEFDTVFVGG